MRWTGRFVSIQTINTRRERDSVNHPTQQATQQLTALSCPRPLVLAALTALHPRRRLPPSAAARTCQRVSS
jgi:hypothetical protein